MASIKDSGEPIPTPFLNSTIDQVYNFYKTHIRLAMWAKYFTNCTFLVIDEEGVRSDPRQCILCSDTPDFGEADDEVTLKQLRLPIAQAMEDADRIESLIKCPSEVGHPSGMALSIMPPPWMEATPARARAAKKAAIRSIRSVDEALGTP